MFFNDHPPPDFQARYGEFETTVMIDTLEIIEGSLPTRAPNLVREWAIRHREELRQDWEPCRANAVPCQDSAVDLRTPDLCIGMLSKCYPRRAIRC